MDMSTIGRSVGDFLKRCPKCKCAVRSPVIYSSCKHVVCWICFKKSPEKCPVCLHSNQSTNNIYIEDLIDWKALQECRILTKEDQEKTELERTRYEDKIKELEMENTAMQESLKKFEDEKHLLEIRIAKFETEKLLTQESLKKFEDEKLLLENQIKKFETEKLLTKGAQKQLKHEISRYQHQIKKLENDKNASIKRQKEELEQFQLDVLRLDNEVKEAYKEISKTKKESQEKIELGRTSLLACIKNYENQIKELEMEKNAAMEAQERLESEIIRHESKIKELEIDKNASIKTEKEDQEKLEPKSTHYEHTINELEMEKKTAMKRCFSCNECDFLVAEYRSRICVDCGLSSGILTKENHKLRLNADTQQIEKENLMCVGCAIEGVHAGHQTVNYQQLKLEPISIEKKKANDTELAEKRDTVVNSQTMITVARLLQTARVELSKLSEETVNAVTWDEFNLTWNSADIELSRAHSITENFLNVADDTEKSLEKVVAGLGAIRTGCKVVVKNSGKGDISEGANRDEIKTDCSASVITDASEWEALSDSSRKSDQKGEI